MPYQTEEYTPPYLPPIGPVRTFEEVRAAVGRIMEYLQRLQAADVSYFQLMRENLNQSATTQGPDIPVAPTISITRFMHVITGTNTAGTALTTINPPLYFAGQLMLVAKDGFYLATGGNIQMFQSPNYLNPTANIMLCFVPSMNLWIADTCRLHTGPSLIRVGHRDLGDTE